MELDNEDLLIDHIQFNQVLEYRVNLNELSTRPRNALKRALLKRSDWQPNSRRFEIMKKLNYIDLNDIQSLRLSDIRDLNHVGESTLVELISELQSALAVNSNSEGGLEDKPQIDTLEIIRARISNSSTVEILTDAMIEYQKSISEITEREEKIWRNRLPWITDTPRTLDSIGSELGVTRGRIRQIQRKSSKFSYDINSPVLVLMNIQNILLECSNYEEFRDAMFEEELTDNELITIGRIRHIAVELHQEEVVSEIERAIYSWSRS